MTRGWQVAMAALALSSLACHRSKVTSKDWNGAIQVVEETTGTKAAPFTRGDHSAPDVVMFQVDDGASIVERHRTRLLDYGAYLFIAEHGFKRDKDTLALAKTTDKFRVVQLVGTDGINYDHDNADVVAWLRQLDRDEPFELSGAGFDYVEGSFRNDVRDPHALARRIYAFCPDFVDQGLGLEDHGTPEELIVRHFAKSRSFFFWWD
jgi:hypothetical protein